MGRAARPVICMLGPMDRDQIGPPQPPGPAAGAPVGGPAGPRGSSTRAWLLFGGIILVLVGALTATQLFLLSGPPTNASRAEFCKAVQSVDKEYAELYADSEKPSVEKRIELDKEWADALEKSGTPEDIPEDAREGFEYVLDHPWSEEDYEAFDKAAQDPERTESPPWEAVTPEEDQDIVRAWQVYLIDTCYEDDQAE